MRRAWRIIAFLVFVSFALFTGGALPGPAAEPDLKLSLNSGLEKIAGEYYQGDGLGLNMTLVINSTGTFTYHAAGCVRTYADIKARDFMRNGMLVLTSEGSASETPFLPVRWGDRLYLIDPDGIVGFANAVNAGHEPRMKAQGVFYLRNGDWNKPVTGGPRLPAAYREYLLAKPIEAEVLGMDDEGNVELSAGRRQGLLPGMKLLSRGTEDDFFCKLTVVSLRAETARAKGSWECSALQAGDRAFTRWRDIEGPYDRREDDF